MKLFKSSRVLETQIDEFLDTVVEGTLVYREGVRAYLQGSESIFESKLKAIDAMEKKADRISSEVETHLYSHSLIPEHRGDVLGLLENTDNIIDTAKASLNQFSVEHPVIPVELQELFALLVDAGYHAVEAAIISARAFFRDVGSVKDNLFKVHHFEKEADEISRNLMRAIFDMDLDLARQTQLRYFAHNVEKVSDRAEEVADRLAIYAIKRTI
ncbi:MAG: DUF47 family protein [Gemmatimonadales bacterium]|nr:DUF47 family protein [Gemmatimonadales bacterium]